MSSIDVNNAPAADGTQGDQDLGPLAWVLDELRKSLDGAVKAMRRFVRDAEAARESDLAALDAGPLRIARQQLHQACGALEMVGMGPPALVLRAMESAVQKFVQRPETCSDDAAAVIERASFALIEYLETVLAGKAASPVALFPQYRDAQALAGGCAWRSRQTAGDLLGALDCVEADIGIKFVLYSSVKSLPLFLQLRCPSCHKIVGHCCALQEE